MLLLLILKQTCDFLDNARVLEQLSEDVLVLQLDVHCLLKDGAHLSELPLGLLGLSLVLGSSRLGQSAVRLELRDKFGLLLSRHGVVEILSLGLLLLLRLEHQLSL